jgi:hypothetical protein
MSLAACALAQPATPPVGCRISVAAPAQSQAALEWRAAVESGPLFVAASAAAPISSCDLASDAQGRITLSYRLRGGGTVEAVRDASVEFSEVAVRFDPRPDVDVLELLKRAETAAFGDKGCGIDWQQGSLRPVGAGAKDIETVFRGDTCNCQALIRRDPERRVRGLTLRSTC